jgi:glycosyltransferase involved in cell wall biosynthesis
MRISARDQAAMLSAAVLYWRFPGIIPDLPVEKPDNDPVMQQNRKINAAVVVPCYNAGNRLRPVIEKLRALPVSVIVIDDGSTDGCAGELPDPAARLVRFGRNRGKGHALIAGYRAALENPDCEAVIMLDADGQHDPGDIPRFLGHFRETAGDLILGARVFEKGETPFMSRFGNLATRAITRLLLGADLPDTQCGFRLLSRSFAEAVIEKVRPGRYETEMEMLLFALRGGWKMEFVPIATIYEPGNRSSHFRKVRDSIRIYARFFRLLFRRTSY